MFKKFLQMSLVLVALLAVTLTGVSDNVRAAAPRPHIIPPDAIYRGKSYGEWAARWWQAVLAVPVVDDKHPILNGGRFHRENGVVFLAAVVGEPATLDVTIREGKALFVPVINAECSVFESDPWHGDDEASLRACANGHIDRTSGRWAKIDGLVVENLQDYRVESPLFEYGPLPANNILGASEGTTSDSVDAGVYLLIAPLPVGNHKLRIRATFDEFGASIETNFNITVLPKD